MKKYSKKLLTALLAAVLLASSFLTACSEGSSTSSDSTETTASVSGIDEAPAAEETDEQPE